ncbi:hypothetical protein FISHEDRAFT_69103 [Fistulina hepatica ATCC 64428]|uniref:Uncharacterized protein n=1 Tax=Fistulina hepatica ATCC 64428 TaxID=1128425 RepID=A0A0D7AND7_9AGAR|nr:hypothetical protein FISHEDRAFT_69103 [Fistulina hepatica ATCC 64428]
MLDLPSEIVAEIAGHIPSTRDVSLFSRSSVFLSECLRPVLYSKVIIDSHEIFSLFHRTISSAPHVRRFLREASFTLGRRHLCGHKSYREIVEESVLEIRQKLNDIILLCDKLDSLSIVGDGHTLNAVNHSSFTIGSRRLAICHRSMDWTDPLSIRNIVQWRNLETLEILSLDDHSAWNSVPRSTNWNLDEFSAVLPCYSSPIHSLFLRSKHPIGNRSLAAVLLMPRQLQNLGIDMALYPTGFACMLALMGSQLQTLRLFNRNSTLADADNIIRAVARCPMLVALDLINFPFLRKHVASLPQTLQSLFLGLEEGWVSNSPSHTTVGTGRYLQTSKNTARKRRRLSPWKHSCAKALVAMVSNRTRFSDLVRVEVQVEACDVCQDNRGTGNGELVGKSESVNEETDEQSSKNEEIDALMVRDTCSAAGVELVGAFASNSLAANSAHIFRHFSVFHAP